MLVDDLAAAKQVMMRGRNPGAWTLVISIHGSQDRLGAQAPPDWQRNAVFYGDASIVALFSGDPEFVRWRNRYGPEHLVMNACQVSAGFERTLISNLTRPPAAGERAQGAPGLGEGCRPLTTTLQLTYDNALVTTRRQWNGIPAADRANLESDLRNLNSEFGYFGRSPVPAADVFRYYFDVAPQGGWPKVVVGVGAHDSERSTNIPFWNRATGPRSGEFHRLCDRGVGRLRGRTGAAPP